MATPPPTIHRNKVVVAWLASLLGVFSIHWWYLGRRHAWLMTTFSGVMLLFAQFYPVWWDNVDRKSTRLNSSHVAISYAVFCLKKKNKGQMSSRSSTRKAGRGSTGTSR